LIIGNSSSGNFVSTLINTGNGIFAAPVNYPVAGRSYGVTVGDLNGDNLLDIVCANDSYNGVNVLLNSGNGTFGTSVDYLTGNNPLSTAVADLNNDGHPDIAIAFYSANSVGVLINTGTGTFNPPVYYAVGLNPLEISVGDINGDNKPDLVTANFDCANHTYPSNYSVLLNNGTGVFSAVSNHTVGIHPSSVSIGDLNGDGSSDLVITHYPYLSLTEDNVWVLFNYTAKITDSCQGSTLILYTTKGGSDYLWSLGGSTADSLIITTTGTYTLTMSSPDGSCTSTVSKTVSTLCPTTAINKKNNFVGCSVFPNPFTSQTTIVFNKEIKNASLKIFDVVGNEVRNINFSGSQILIEKEDLNKGIYFINVISENEVIANEKIVIQ